MRGSPSYTFLIHNNCTTNMIFVKVNKCEHTSQILTVLAILSGKGSLGLLGSILAQCAVPGMYIANSDVDV